MTAESGHLDIVERILFLGSNNYNRTILEVIVWILLKKYYL